MKLESNTWWRINEPSGKTAVPVATPAPSIEKHLEVTTSSTLLIPGSPYTLTGEFGTPKTALAAKFTDPGDHHVLERRNGRQMVNHTSSLYSEQTV